MVPISGGLFHVTGLAPCQRAHLLQLPPQTTLPGYQRDIPGEPSGTNDCAQVGDPAVAAFHAIARQHLKRPLPGPFNHAARALATMEPQWYMPLSSPRSRPVVKQVSGANVRHAK